MKINDLTLKDEHLRIAVNINQIYEQYIDVLREYKKLPSNMAWQSVNNNEYLYVTYPSMGNPKSEGLRNVESEHKLRVFQETKATYESRLNSMLNSLNTYLVQYKALRLPLIGSLPAKILRELDVRGQLGSYFMVVGTNAFGVYEIIASERFAHGLDETEDFDLSWCMSKTSLFCMSEQPLKGSPLLTALLAVDKSFQLNKRKPYQAVNRDAYEVELLTAPSVMSTLSKDEQFSTAAIPEQEWLLLGTPLRYVLCSKDGKPAPLYVPDPRYMALHKMWLSNKEERRPDKKDKDFKQGDLLLSAVTRKLQSSYPVDVSFVLTLPDELMDVFNDWCSRHQYIPGIGQSTFLYD